MKARDYEIIEERFNINVNVFGYDNRDFSLYAIKKIKWTRVLNVLLISNDEKSHYVFIKDCNRLMYYCNRLFTNIIVIDYSQIKTKNIHKSTLVWHVYKILLLKKY